jgi:uncharacterized membrane protein YjdF
MSEVVAHPAPESARGLTWQKLILGDWTRIVRDPLDVARIAFVVSTIVWILLGHAMTGLVAASAVIILARVISLPRFYDASVILVMFLLAWGSALSIYGSWGFYDNLVHFITPLLTTGMLYLLLVRLGVLPDFHDLKQLHHRIGFFLTVLALGMAIGAGWEVIEWTLDQFSDVGRVASADDTATDLISDTLGSAGSALILVLWSLGNHSMLRRPGSELASKKFHSFLAVRHS